MDIYKKMLSNAQNYKQLYHYTSEDTLRLIQENKLLLVNSLKRVNDPDENKRITSLWNDKIYVACFSHGEENKQYMAQKYGREQIVFDGQKLNNCTIYADTERNLQLHRVKSSNVAERSYDKEHWGFFDYSLADVFYTDDLAKHTTCDGELNAGLVKMQGGWDNEGVLCDWSIEQETRIRIALRPMAFENRLCEGRRLENVKPPFERLYIDVSDAILEVNHITF